MEELKTIYGRCDINMYKVISQWNIGKYVALELNQSLPKTEYRKYRISGKEYEPIPVYDLPKHIAIEATGNFEGETVEFIWCHYKYNINNKHFASDINVGNMVLF